MHYTCTTHALHALHMHYSCHTSNQGGKFFIKSRSLFSTPYKTILWVINKLIKPAPRDFETALLSASPSLLSYFSSTKIVFHSQSGWKTASWKRFRLVVSQENSKLKTYSESMFLFWQYRWSHLKEFFVHWSYIINTCVYKYSTHTYEICPCIYVAGKKLGNKALLMIENFQLLNAEHESFSTTDKESCG